MGIVLDIVGDVVSVSSITIFSFKENTTRSLIWNCALELIVETTLFGRLILSVKEPRLVPPEELTLNTNKPGRNFKINFPFALAVTEVDKDREFCEPDESKVIAGFTKLDPFVFLI